MHRPIVLAGVFATVLVASPALATDRYGTVDSFGGRHVAADPDEKLERLAAASTRATGKAGHDRPTKSGRNILRNAPYIQSAFAWMDNK